MPRGKVEICNSDGVRVINFNDANVGRTFDNGITYIQVYDDPDEYKEIMVPPIFIIVKSIKREKRKEK